MNIILIAPPAGGKGTQSKMICSSYNLAHISTGDLLRMEVARGNDELANIMNSGKLVSDEIVLKLIDEYISNNVSLNGFLFDGFPRNIAQAEKLNDILGKYDKKIDYVILLDINKDLASKRISGRRSCPNCGASYNIYFDSMKPKNDGLCDKCGNKLASREDDNQETYAKRYETYLESTKPLLDFYKDVLYTIDASKTPEETFKQIKDIVEVI